VAALAAEEEAVFHRAEARPLQAAVVAVAHHQEEALGHPHQALLLAPLAKVAHCVEVLLPLVYERHTPSRAVRSSAVRLEVERVATSTVAEGTEAAIPVALALEARQAWAFPYLLATWIRSTRRSWVLRLAGVQARRQAGR